jgi:hypothetical protein
MGVARPVLGGLVTLNVGGVFAIPASFGNYPHSDDFLVRPQGLRDEFDGFTGEVV